MIFESYREAVQAYCLRRLDPDRANDAAAEVFLVAWRRIDHMPEPAQALPWLCGVARRFMCAAGTMSQADAMWDFETKVMSFKCTFTCGDGSGEFTTNVDGDFQPGEVFWFSGEWTVLEGTGAYEGLTGTGTTKVMCTNPAAPECHEDHDGQLEPAG
jgi:hypothetical protein